MCGGVFVEAGIKTPNQSLTGLCTGLKANMNQISVGSLVKRATEPRIPVILLFVTDPSIHVHVSDVRCVCVSACVHASMSVFLVPYLACICM